MANHRFFWPLELGINLGRPFCNGSTVDSCGKHMRGCSGVAWVGVKGYFRKVTFLHLNWFQARTANEIFIILFVT